MDLQETIGCNPILSTISFDYQSLTIITAKNTAKTYLVLAVCFV